jgi:hypothetical protein
MQQAEYFKTVDAAVARATNVLARHHLQPQKYRVHIRSKGLSDPSEQHALSISTADGAVWVTEASFPFRCIAEVDPFGADAFCSIVAEKLTELVRKIRQAGRAL